jgi:hypothetical protein
VTLTPGRPDISTAIEVVSVAGCHSQARPGQTVAHYLDIHFVADFFVEGVLFVPGARTHTGQGKFSAGWCAPCCKLPNMTMEFYDPVGDRVSSGSLRFCGTKISENFCGIFVLLCYIPAPLMNQN